MGSLQAVTLKFVTPHLQNFGGYFGALGPCLNKGGIGVRGRAYYEPNLSWRLTWLVVVWLTLMEILTTRFGKLGCRMSFRQGLCVPLGL